MSREVAFYSFALERADDKWPRAFVQTTIHLLTNHYRPGLFGLHSLKYVINAGNSKIDISNR